MAGSSDDSQSSPSRNLYAEYGVFPPSSSSSDSESSINLGIASACSNQAQVSQIFKVVHHFAHNGRLATVEELKKNMDLITYISSIGHSMEDVNKFVLGKNDPISVNDVNLKNALVQTISGFLKLHRMNLLLLILLLQLMVIL